MENDLPLFYPSQHFMDKALKWLLRKPEHFQELLEFLAPSLAERMDFSVFEPRDSSFISKEFRERVSDGLYYVGWKGHGDETKEAFIYVHFEHQSKPDSWIRYRFFQAQAAIWQRYYDRWQSKPEKKPYFPPVIPLLVYTGKTSWKVPSLREVLGFEEMLSPFTPEMDLLFLGLFTSEGQEFIRQNTALSLCFEVLVSLEFTLEEFKKVLGTVEEQLWEKYRDHPVFYWDLRFLVGVIYHRRPSGEQEQLVEFIKANLPENEIRKEIEMVEKSYADVLLEEGIEKGELKKSQESILRFLKARFGEVSTSITQKVNSTQDMEKLDSWIDLAATCASLEDFEKGM